MNVYEKLKLKNQKKPKIMLNILLLNKEFYVVTTKLNKKTKKKAQNLKLFFKSNLQIKFKNK